MTRILTSAAGQRYAVDDEFEDRLSRLIDVEVYESEDGQIQVEANVADLLDFLSAEGLI